MSFQNFVLLHFLFLFEGGFLFCPSALRCLLLPNILNIKSLLLSILSWRYFNVTCYAIYFIILLVLPLSQWIIFWFQTIKQTRDPRWNEEFQSVLEEASINEKIHIQGMSRRKGFIILFTRRMESYMWRSNGAQFESLVQCDVLRCVSTILSFMNKQFFSMER